MATGNYPLSGGYPWLRERMPRCSHYDARNEWKMPTHLVPVGHSEMVCGNKHRAMEVGQPTTARKRAA
eukprot:205930-Lingulodinium_polyedra.AAC.1